MSHGLVVLDFAFVVAVMFGHKLKSSDEILRVRVVTLRATIRLQYAITWVVSCSPPPLHAPTAGHWLPVSSSAWRQLSCSEFRARQSNRWKGCVHVGDGM